MFAGGSRNSNRASVGGGNVAQHSHLKYRHRLNLYAMIYISASVDLHERSYLDPPVDEVTLEEFESCAIDRIRVLSEIESSLARNRSAEEMQKVCETHMRKHVPLDANTAARSVDVDVQRKRDHLGHFVLRLAFCRSCVSGSTCYVVRGN